MMDLIEGTYTTGYGVFHPGDPNMPVGSSDSSDAEQGIPIDPMLISTISPATPVSTHPSPSPLSTLIVVPLSNAVTPTPAK